MERVPVQESQSKLTLSLSLIWETERPLENKDCQSPPFTFKNCEWYLKLQLFKSRWRKPRYRLSMVPTKEQKKFPPFLVKTYYKIGDANMFYDCKTVSPGSHFISCVTAIDLRPQLGSFYPLRIVCVFDEPDNCTQLSGSLEEQSVHLSMTTIPKDNTFSLENLSKDLESLLDKEISPDVQLMVEKTCIPCHRTILVARSEVFAAMFQHEMTESTSGILKIKDIDLSSIKVFLKYLYSGKIPDDLKDEELIKLFKAADKYQVHALKRVCSEEMIKTINEENCLSYLILAETHNDQEFKDAVACFIVKDGRLLKSSDWFQFSAENSSLAVEVYRKYVSSISKFPHSLHAECNESYTGINTLY